METTNQRLQGKACLITGAAGDIGTATARVLAARGASLFLVDRDPGRLADLRSSMLASGVPAVHAEAADVTDAAAVQRFTRSAVEAMGKLDFLFANAGIEGPVTPPQEYPDDGFEAVMRVNTTGVFLCLKQALASIAPGGSIVITSSIAGLSGTPNTIGYCASKHAVVGLMRSAAKTAAARKVRINCVHPGFVDSQMLRRIEAELAARGAPSPRAAMVAATPMGQCVDPEDIAQAVAFLASDESRFVTGQTLAVDGGYLL